MFLAAPPATLLPPHSGHWRDEGCESASPATKTAPRFRRQRLTRGPESIIGRGSCVKSAGCDFHFRCAQMREVLKRSQGSFGVKIGVKRGPGQVQGQEEKVGNCFSCSVPSDLS